MSERLAHHVNIDEKLEKYGIDTGNEPTIHALGGRVVTAETDARRALRALAAQLNAEDADLDDLDPADLTEAAEALTAYHRARRDLLRQADRLGLLETGPVA
jgi:hypothetical protein